MQSVYVHIYRIVLDYQRGDTMTEAQKRATKKYLNDQDELKVRMPKGQKTIIEKYAKEHNQSMNGFITEAINKAMGRG